MKKVDKETFYKAFMDKDVLVEVLGDYPYTSCFVERYGGAEIGRKIGMMHGEDEYYLVGKEE